MFVTDFTAGVVLPVVVRGSVRFDCNGSAWPRAEAFGAGGLGTVLDSDMAATAGK